jgi:membrane protein implicated in regulation of membrane protease activity
MDAWIWGTIAVALFIVELVAPGYFLIFPALGAFAVGLADLAGITGLEAQLVGFVAFSALLFALLVRHYRRLISNQKQDPVNLPERLVGAQGTVEDRLTAGRGKIRLGDSVWLARGPDLEKGHAVRVAAVEGTVLVVVPAD